MDLAMLPPEINSTRIYTGPGAGPMLAAAGAWAALAAQLELAATTYSSMLSELIAEWTGPSSTKMASAAERFIAWQRRTAAMATQTAAQEQAAAAAYEAAFAATVPPAVVTANRALQASLIGTNFLGQNSAAIAAVELQYMEMWAQDSAAMLGYAQAAASASQLRPFTDPPPSANADVAGASPALSLLSALTGPFSPPSLLSPALGGYLFATEMYGLPSVAANVAELSDKVAALPAEAGGTTPVGNLRSGLRMVGSSFRPSADVGGAELVGRLSVPRTWVSAVPAANTVVSVPAGSAPGIGGAMIGAAQRGGWLIDATGGAALTGAAGRALASAGGPITVAPKSGSGAGVGSAVESIIFVITADESSDKELICPL